MEWEIISKILAETQERLTKGNVEKKDANWNIKQVQVNVMDGATRESSDSYRRRRKGQERGRIKRQVAVDECEED